MSTLAGHGPPLLHSRAVDGLLLGGLALLAWPLLFAVVTFSPWHDVPQAVLLPAIFVVNYPHFMASYKLGYGQGLRFVGKSWPQLVLVPVLLAAVIVLGWSLRGTPAEGFAPARAVDAVLGAIGSATRAQDYGNAANVVCFLLLHAMYFSVGWHYAKQCFGAMMVRGRLDGFDLDRGTRRALLVHLTSLWLLAYLGPNADDETVVDAGGFVLRHIDVPRVVPFGLTIALTLSGAWFARSLLLLVRDKGRPALGWFLPLGAAYVWLLPAWRYPAWLALLPVLHSLQYLVFVARIERRRERASRAAAYALPVVLVVAGALAFYVVPHALDRALGERGAYFFATIGAAINLHHYFIDNVIWRFHNPEVKRLLLG